MRIDRSAAPTKLTAHDRARLRHLPPHSKRPIRAVTMVKILFVAAAVVVAASHVVEALL